MSQCDLGLIGLAVMGQNLVLNMAGRGFRVAVHNRTLATAKQFVAGPAAGLPIELGESLADFVLLLKRPRVAMLMVKAGQPVDDTIAALAPLLEPGDMILDCGNSFYADTERRAKELAARGLEFMGVGVSGGEAGALKGPSIMPGGPVSCWVRVKPVLTAIAARVGGEPCVAHIGPGGAGHFVKMVHNGIEYGDMQLIAEVYDLLRAAGLGAREIGELFSDWNNTALASYLVEITARCLLESDPDTGGPLVDVILDAAGQKGTGRWTTLTAVDLGAPVPTITAAVDARSMSARLDLRREATAVLHGPSAGNGDREALKKTAAAALYAARLALYDQGIALLHVASEKFGYGLKIPELAQIWRGGCIIRSALLDLIRAAFDQPTPPAGLLLFPKIAAAMNRDQQALRDAVIACAAAGVGAPALSSALAYYDYYRSVRLPMNLTQAQRDLFGAHTFERTDKGGIFHHQW